MSNWFTKRLKKYIGYIVPDSQEKINKEAYDYWNKKDLETNDMSHWKETGRWEEEQIWESVGNEHVEMFQRFKRYLDINSPTKSMVEWGPGGAANLSKFSKEFEIMYGVDISIPNLEQCGDELKKRGVKGFTPVHIGIDNPENALQQIGIGETDFFLCTAVYQHFPGQQFAERVTNVAYKLLKSGGLAIIQTRYNNGDKKLNPKKANYKHNILTFTTFYLEEFWIHLKKAGFEPEYLSIDTERNYAYYFVRKI